MAPKATRQRLVAAARKVLLEQGLDAGSVRSVTSEAEANVASIHYHFGSRDGLIREVVVGAARDLAEAWSAVRRLPGADQAELNLVGVFGLFLESVARNRVEAALVARALVASDARLRNAVSAELAEGLRALESIVAQLEPEMERKAIHLTLCQVLGSALLWLPDTAILERLGDTRYRWADTAGLISRWAASAANSLRLDAVSDADS